MNEKHRNWVVEIVRGATRPIITVIFAAVIAQVVVEHIVAPEWFIGLALSCIGWWFVDRTLLHKGEQKVSQTELLKQLAEDIKALKEQKRQ